MAYLGKHVCEYCGKDCGNPPALVLHLKFCKEKNKNECKHIFRLLNEDVTSEYNALSDGYLEVCTICNELK